MLNPSILDRTLPQGAERLGVRLMASDTQAKGRAGEGGAAEGGGDVAIVLGALAPLLGGRAAERCRPWLAEALAERGTTWHSAATDEGPAWLMLTVLADATGERHALVTIDRNRSEAALEARIAAARLDAMISSAGALCHTLNNVLTSLLGNAEMLAETENLPEEAKLSASLILRAGERLDTLTSRTLGIGRARRPGPGRCDPHDQLLRLVAALRPPGAIEVCVPPGLGTLLVDPRAFDSAATHLLRNAMTAAGPGGTVRLRAGLEDSLAWPGFAWLRVTVEDDGPGLPAAELALPGGGLPNSGKSGNLHPCGLASVRAFATALGGSLEAANGAGGRGASVTLRLPVRDAAEATP
jgi:signal transduction histidine kinase